MPPVNRNDPPDPAPGRGPIVDPTGKPASDQILQVKLSDLEAMLTRVVAAVSAGHGQGSEMLQLATKAMDDLKQQVARNRIVSNSLTDYHGESEFAPHGKAEKRKHRLRYKDVFYLGDKLREESLTPAEIDMLNRFAKDVEARDGKWTAVLSRESGKPVLTITAPFGTMDNRNQLPSLLLICQELLDGTESADPNALMSRLAAAEQQIAQLTSQLSIQ